MNFIIASILFIFALGVRFLFFPYWKNLPLGGDENYYWDLACRISQGEFVPPNLFLRPPLWSYVLSIPALFSHSHLWGRIFATILGAAATPFMYFLGNQVFSKRVGIIAAILFAIYPNYIGFSHYLWAETFYLLCSLIITYFFFKTLNNKFTRSKFYILFAFMGITFFLKETAMLFFAACVITLWHNKIEHKYSLFIYAILLFCMPVVIYSTYASYQNRRIIILADAPFYNANQVNHGAEPWQLSPEENQKLFVRDFLGKKIKNVFRTYPQQFEYFWTPNSFVLYRLIDAKKFGNYNMPYASIGAYIGAGVYILIMLLGLTGMFLTEKSPFQTFSISYVALICLSGTIFLLCSRFRIPLMFLFILHASQVISHPKQLISGCTQWKLVAWVVSILLFGIVIATKWGTIGMYK